MIDLQTILPGIAGTLDGIGFLFGAGTSCEAGYPMMPELTRQVVAALDVSRRAVLDEVLASTSAAYDPVAGTPNIEQLSDMVLSHSLTTGDARFGDLETRFRELILEAILAVTNPILDNHIRFFEALKRRCHGLPVTIWIFTTNYDLLFETAATHVGVTIENGFSGSTKRFLDPARFQSRTGRIVAGRFEPDKRLTVKLVKLHGSVSWFADSSRFFEMHPDAMAPAATRVLIHPRRMKVMDTLQPPYDTLFTLTSAVIGTECMYLASCGFSYSDEHITSNLLVPVMQSRKCRLFALCADEPTGVSAFKSMPNFGGGFRSHLHKDGKTIPGTTDLWQFGKFVNLF